MISIKVTNDESITDIGAAPIPLIETASIPLPIQNFSNIIDDLNVGTIPMELSINQPIESTENLPPTFTTNQPQEESTQDGILVTKSSSSRLILSSLLFYCHI